jgi:hypothetical protein
MESDKSILENLITDFAFVAGLEVEVMTFLKELSNLLRMRFIYLIIMCKRTQF